MMQLAPSALIESFQFFTFSLYSFPAAFKLNCIRVSLYSVKMDAFELDSMKTEKAKAMLRFNLLQFIWKTFRLIELCLVVILLSWTSARLPFAIRISTDYFRRLISVLVSPIFVFVLSNAIVFALLFKTGQNPTINNAEPDLYHETELDLDSDQHHHHQQEEEEEENIVYEDKRVIIEAKLEESIKEDKIEIVQPDEKTMMMTKKKLYRRTQSEKLMKENTQTTPKELRRSETEIYERKSDVEAAATVSVVDELSNEEFQKKIEAFIAKQVKFHQEEKSAIVTC
ncbi:uncharacterized protein LOC124931455 [Impatiens glandulifera]|uniref:uncharacterized protein LOC124931455 n=1 Tax=Impatiens glandulifera TaxID=253017 RepID=UPI001FB05BA5|nr:uncharacterized protein LOC124931455 [Impatiens glandulifera]